jgi:hypothetical protein
MRMNGARCAQSMSNKIPTKPSWKRSPLPMSCFTNVESRRLGALFRRPSSITSVRAPPHRGVERRARRASRARSPGTDRRLRLDLAAAKSCWAYTTCGRGLEPGALSYSGIREGNPFRVGASQFDPGGIWPDGVQRGANGFRRWNCRETGCRVNAGTRLSVN